MSSTINSAFARFKDKLAVPDIQADRLAARQDEICRVLRQKIMVVNNFIGGSYVRSTMIPPLNTAEIDLFVVLESHYFHHFSSKRRGHAALVGMIKWALRQTYRAPVVSRNGRSVTIWFSDFGVNIVPVMLRLNNGYVMPNARTESWTSTNPRRHDQILSDADEAHNQMLVPLIRMIKAWNRDDGLFFTSFHIEAMALELLHGTTLIDFPSALLLFFDRARHAVIGKTLDPAGYDNDVGDYINTTARVAEAKKRLTDAYEATLRAEQRSAADEYTAIDLWRQLIPGSFPANLVLADCRP